MRTGDEAASDGIVIVGAGAAGLASAIFARRAGCPRVVLLDGAAKPGAKILVSGGSRCNVTNAVVTERDYWGGRPAIIRRVLSRLPVARTIEFFEDLGVPLKREPTGKLFPRSDRSRDVLDALLGAARALDVTVRPSTRVQRVDVAGTGFRLETSAGSIQASSVVLATGGLSLPKTGSDGAGLQMARALGHTIVPTTPALAPLVLQSGGLHERLSGVAQDVQLTVRVDGRTAERIPGPMLWTHFGISGPAALDVSRHWLRARLDGREAALAASLRPGGTFEAVEADWTRLATEQPRVSVQTALAELLPSSVASELLHTLGIDGTTRLAQFTREHRRSLSHALVDLPLPVLDSRGYNYAEATAGGVALDEIDPASMQSRKRPGLFLVGEMLDVDGRLGGFNFQWAWSSARTAAEGLARRLSVAALFGVLLLAGACSGKAGDETTIRVVDLLKEAGHAERRPLGGDFPIAEHACEGDSRLALATPPVSRVTWETKLPARGVLQTAAAVAGDPGASAIFRIGISDDRIYELLFERTVTAAECEQGWVPIAIDLSAYGGRKLSLFYRPDEKEWRLVFSVNTTGDATEGGLWALPGVDTDRDAAKAFFEKRGGD